MNSKWLLLSNNPLVWKHSAVTCIRVDGTPLQVFHRGLELLAEGRHMLYAHPVAGNERLLRNPFRSLVFVNRPIREELQKRQLRLMDRYIGKLEEIDFGRFSESERADYGIVDFDLLTRSLPSDL